MSDFSLESSDFDAVDRFVENEAHTRFDIDPPTDLLDWTLIGEQYSKNEDQTGSTPSSNEESRKELMLRKTWSDFRDMLETDGYPGLQKLEKKLDERCASEEVRLDSHRDEVRILDVYLNLVREAIDAGQDRGELEYQFLHGEGSPIPGFRRAESVNSMPGVGNLRVALNESAKRVNNIPKSPPPLRIGSQESLEDVKERLQNRMSKAQRKVEAASQVCRLVGFRREVLKKFLWTYEVAGKPVEDAATSSVPNEVPRKRVRYVCTVLNAIPDEEEDVKGMISDRKDWPTQQQLANFLKDQYDESLRVKPLTIVEKAAALLRDNLFTDRYESFSTRSPTFWELVLEHKSEIEDLGPEKDLDVPDLPGSKSE